MDCKITNKNALEVMMKPVTPAIVFLILSSILAPTTFAQTTQDFAGSAKLHQVTLDNGLRVILLEDHKTPTVSICLTYDVGSRDEAYGRTGFAHLFEHMMFQGSKNVGKGEYFFLVEENGGDLSATTNPDRTNYFATFPASQLELALFLEADRMRSLVVTQANLDNQRNTVQEQRRQSIDNRAYGRTREVVLDIAYDGFAYRHSTSGSIEDLDDVTVQDVNDFFDKYYSPSNAVLVLVGAFQTADALARIQKHFGDLRARPRPDPVELNESQPKAERRKTIRDPFARSPRIDLVYKVPSGNTKSWFALKVLTEALVGGRWSRLSQKLVSERKVALSASAELQERRGPSLLWFVITPQRGQDPLLVEQSVYREIEAIKEYPLEEWELERAKNQLRRQYLQQIQSTLMRSILISQYAIYYGEPNLINTMVDELMKVSKSDIQSAARSYLQKANRIVVLTIPEQEAPPISQSKLERKNRAPVSKTTLKLTFPTPVEKVLSKGLAVLMVEDHTSPVISVEVHVQGAGPLFDPADRSGLSDVAGRLLTEGTKDRTGAQFTKELERTGAQVSVVSELGSPNTVIKAYGLSSNFEAWFPLIADALVHPSFPEEALADVKEKLKAQLRSEQASASFLAGETFRKAVFGNHPAGISPTPTSIDKITRQDLVNWHGQKYVSQHIILGIAGDINPHKLLPGLEKWFGDLRQTISKVTFPMPPQSPSKTTVYLVDRPRSEQTHIIVGNLAIDRFSPDYVPMVVLNRLVGEGFTSRLMLNLREEKGYTAVAHSSLTALQYPGPWHAYSNMRTGVTAGALAELLSEIQRLREQEVPLAELEAAKRGIVANLMLTLEGGASAFVSGDIRRTYFLSHLITRKVFGFPTDYWDTYQQKVLDVTAKDIQRVAQKYLNPATLQIVAVGDGSKIRSILEKYGPVTLGETPEKTIVAR
jgi:zinc protease